MAVSAGARHVSGLRVWQGLARRASRWAASLLHLLTDVAEVLRNLLGDGLERHHGFDLPPDQTEERQVVHQAVQLLVAIHLYHERPRTLAREDAAADLALLLKRGQRL